MRLIPLLFAATTTFGSLADAACQMDKVASLPATVDHGLIYIAGSINGTPVRYLVDTTADSLILPGPAHAMELYQMLHPRDRSFVYLDEGKLGPVFVDDMKVGDLQFKRYIMHVLGRRENFGAPDQIAVLGRDFLRKFDVEFDLKHGKINLYNPSGCETANLAFWSDRYNVVDMLDGDDLLYYHINDFRRYIPDMKGTFLPAKVNGHDVVAVLDSGSAQSILSSGAAHDLGITLTSAKSRFGDGYSLIYNHKLESWQGAVDSVAIDQEVVKPATLLVRRTEASDELLGYGITGTNLNRQPIYTADMVLGADFLLSHHVMLSNSQRKVYFTYEGGQPFHGEGSEGHAP
jgi:hypothetical protein